MRCFRNNRGHALVITLLIFALFTLLALTLFAVTSTGIKRTKTSAENVQALELAKMGVEQLSESIQADLQQAIDQQGPLEKNQFSRLLNDTLKKYHGIENAVHYNGKTGDYTAYIFDVRDISNKNNQLPTRQVTIISQGKTEGQTKIVETKMNFGARTILEPLRFAISTNKVDGEIDGEGNLFLHGGVSIVGDMNVEGNLIIHDHSIFINKSILQDTFLEPIVQLIESVFQLLNIDLKILEDRENWVPSVYPDIQGIKNEEAKIFLQGNAYNMDHRFVKYLDHIKNEKFEMDFAYENINPHLHHILGDSVSIRKNEQEVEKEKINITDQKDVFKYNENSADISVECGVCDSDLTKIPLGLLIELIVDLLGLDVLELLDSVLDVLSSRGILTIDELLDLLQIGKLLPPLCDILPICDILDFINDLLKKPLEVILEILNIKPLDLLLELLGKLGDVVVKVVLQIINADYYNNLHLIPKYQDKDLYSPYKHVFLENNTFKRFATKGNAYIISTRGETNVTFLEGAYIGGDLTIGNGRRSSDKKRYDNIKVDGPMYVEGDLFIKGANAKFNSIIYVDGDVVIENSIINGLGTHGSLIIFATGNINVVNTSLFEDTPSYIKAYLYSDKTITLFGTLSNLKIEGGISARRIVLNAVRGKVSHKSFTSSHKVNGIHFQSPQQQTDPSQSRLQIIYDPEIMKTYADIKSREPAINEINQPIVIEQNIIK